jgi:Flp pilus assembly protein TadD
LWRSNSAPGDALARDGRTDEARREFEKTIEAAQASPIYGNAEFRALEELKRLPGN